MEKFIKLHDQNISTVIQKTQTDVESLELFEQPIVHIDKVNNRVSENKEMLEKQFKEVE